MESACHGFEILLSAYADGEVGGRERGQVEMHLSGCADCRARLEDLRALSARLSQHLTGQAEAADFSGFADAVLKRITPVRPGLLERLRVAWVEVLDHHRIAVISSLATAAVTLVVAVPLAWRLASSRASDTQVVLRDLQLSDSRLRPVVMNLGEGKTLIMLVSQPDPDEEATPDLTPPPPTEGEL